MSRSMYLLCAAAVGLAACGSKEDVTNLANGAANSAADAANSAANAANTAANTATNAADSAESAAKGGQGYGQPGKPSIKLDVKKVGFVGCTRLVKVSKPGGCMVAQYGSVIYDIDSAKPRPAPNRAISGTGLYLPNAQGTCMVGKPLSGVKWSYTKGHCPAGKGKG